MESKSSSSCLPSGLPNQETVGEVDDESAHFQKIVRAFLFYETSSLDKCDNQADMFNQLPKHHKRLIPHIPAHIEKVRQCVRHNFAVIKQVIHNTAYMFENSEHQPYHKQVLGAGVTGAEMDKVRSTLRQVVRDWGEEGAAERDECYGPVLRELHSLFPDTARRRDVRVLVPGAGLGRLTHECARHGFSCQGNEWSLFMLFVSNFILNKCSESKMMTIYPWVDQFTNSKSAAHQLTPVEFPDIRPSDLPPSADFSMTAGDFLEVYRDDVGQWECVVTVFFIDTAHNILEYIETFHRLLKHGGYWINLGPLLYHYADMAGEMSIELSYSDIKDLMPKMGFTIKKEQMDMPSTYTQNPHSMLQYNYRSVFFVAQKTGEGTSESDAALASFRTAHSVPQAGDS